MDKINADQVTSLLGFFMVLTNWLHGKGLVDMNDSLILESIIFLAFSYFTNKGKSIRDCDDK